MNIAFLVGNGFDLNLKLKTRYQDFYQYYSKNSEQPTNQCLERLKSDILLWGDVELELGEYSQHFDDPNKFLFCVSDIQKKLKKYLQTLKIGFDIYSEENKAQLRKIVGNGLVKFYENLPEAPKNQIRQMVSQVIGTVNYNFIDFNYTHTFQNIIQDIEKGKNPFFNVGARNYKIGKYLKIHGDVFEPIILGVDNRYQIINENLSNDKNIQNNLVKTHMHKLLENNNESILGEIINKAQVVCIYGMSIGETDRYVWNQILTALRRNPNLKVVIFIQSELDLSEATLYEINNEKETYKKRLNPDNKDDMLNSRIFVCNKQLLDFSSLFLDEKQEFPLYPARLNV